MAFLPKKQKKKEVYGLLVGLPAGLLLKWAANEELDLIGPNMVYKWTLGGFIVHYIYMYIVCLLYTNIYLYTSFLVLGFQVEK